MIYIEKLSVSGLEAATRGMRNPMNSWDKMDGYYVSDVQASGFGPGRDEYSDVLDCDYRLGDNDRELARKLAEASLESGNASHAKYRRFITVTCDITAPLYWWKEMDQYKISTVTNSCSTMHKITSKEFTLDDFSHEHLTDVSEAYLARTIEYLNELRDLHNNWGLFSEEERQGLKQSYPRGPKDIWWQIIQLLPSSYNQKRTWMGNYEVISNILHQRYNHKLDEWVGFSKCMRDYLPYEDLLI